MSRTIGIEIEGAGISPGACKTALRGVGIPTSGRNGWKCKYDGSSGVDFEVASPALEVTSDWVEKTKEVCNALRNAGARVNRGCGIHVHVDISDYSPAHVVRLGKLWVRLELAINNLLSRSRQTNGFCKNNHGSLNAFANNISIADGNMDANSRGTVQATLRAIQNTAGRYYKMNLGSFGRHGTVEFRGHQGSLNGNKIAKWARLCLSVIEWAKGNRDLGSARWNLPEALDTLSLYAFNTDEELSGVTTSRTFTPRAGTKKEALFNIYDANAHLGVREAATLAVNAGISTRKVATDGHWHWRKVTTVSRVVNTVTADENAVRRSSWVSYMIERAAELEIDNQYIGSTVQDTTYTNR